MRSYEFERRYRAFFKDSVEVPLRCGRLWNMLHKLQSAGYELREFLYCLRVTIEKMGPILLCYAIPTLAVVFALKLPNPYKTILMWSIIFSVASIRGIVVLLLKLKQLKP